MRWVAKGGGGKKRRARSGDYGAGRDPKMPLFAQPTALSARKEIING